MNKRFFNQQNLTRRLRLLSVLFAMVIIPNMAWGQWDTKTFTFNGATDDILYAAVNDETIGYSWNFHIDGHYCAALVESKVKISVGDNYGKGVLTPPDGFTIKKVTLNYSNLEVTEGSKIYVRAVNRTDTTTHYTDPYLMESDGTLNINLNENGVPSEDLGFLIFSNDDKAYSYILNSITIIKAVDYQLSIGDVPLTGANVNSETGAVTGMDGFYFTPAAGSTPATLTLENVYYGASLTGIVWSGSSDLKIQYSGNNTINTWSGAELNAGNDGYCIIAKNNTSNLILSATNDASTLTLRPSNGGTPDSNNSRAAISGFSNVTLDSGWGMYYTDDYSAATATSLTAGAEVLISKGTPLNITIAGVLVTSGNASNITGDNITGTVSYDAENKILMLNNATIIPTTEDCGIAYTGTADLTISLKGTNNVVKGNGGCSAIGYYGNEAPDLTFTKGDTNPCSLLLEAVGAKTASASTTIDGFRTVSHTGLYKIEETIPGDVNNTYKTTITSLGGGSGTAADPIIIKTTDDLMNFSKLVNNGTINTAAMYFRLAPEGGTLDCSGLSESEYKPIGSGSQPFKGTFSGNGCTISNLIAYEGGLFGNISGATIEDLNLSNCTIAGNDYCIAGLATDASNGSTINLCTITNSTIECLSNQYDPTVGGIVARLSGNETTISNCVVNNTLIKAETTNSTGTSGVVGGIVGEATSGKIENCHVKDESKITDYNANAGATLNAGAIVGKYTGTTLSGNYYYYDVTIETLKGTDTANKETKDGYTQRALGNGDSDVDGAVMYTKTLTLPAGVNSECNFYGPLSDNANGILALAPEQDVDIYLYPADGKIISAASLVYTLNGEQTVPLTNIGDVDQYRYSFKMPDVNATLNTTLVQGYDLWIGTTQVTSDNAGNVLGDGKVSFTESVGVDTGSTYTLTLNGVELTVPIKVGLANLTIDIQGANTITTDGTCIQNVATTGTPSLTFKSTSAETGSLILTKGDDGRISDIGEGNLTISKELAVLLTVYGIEDYTSRLYSITDGSTSVAKIVPGYGVSMGKGGGHRIDVYAGNADDVFGDGTVSFNKDTNTLTLNGANWGDLSTSLSELTVELVGNNTLTESASFPVFRSLNGATVKINIQSTGATKGTLTLSQGNTTAGNFYDGNVTVKIIEPLAVISGSLTNNFDNNNTAVIGVSCQLTVSFSTSNEWATYYGSENLATPEGLEAYQVTAVDGSTVTIGEIGYIPANTAVLLKNVSNNNTWSNIAASAYTGATLTFASNKLIGTASDVDVSTISGGTVYVLYNNMFKRATGGTIPANRGYLVVEPSVVNVGSGAPELSISIGDETTSIDNGQLTIDNYAGEWYSIDGVKLNGQPQKPGLYIKNGKKVFINKK